MEASPEKLHVTVCLCRHTHPRSVQFTSPCQNRQTMSASRVSLGFPEHRWSAVKEREKEREREREREIERESERGCGIVAALLGRFRFVMGKTIA